MVFAPCAIAIAFTISTPPVLQTSEGAAVFLIEHVGALDESRIRARPLSQSSTQTARSPLVHHLGGSPEGDVPTTIRYTPDGARIVISHRESRNLIIWDATNYECVGEIPVSGMPLDFDITPDGATAIVACFGTDSVSIVDLDSMTETSVIPIGGFPGTVRIAPAGDIAAVHVSQTSSVKVVEIESASVIDDIRVVHASLRVTASSQPPEVWIKFRPFEFFDGDQVFHLDQVDQTAQLINVRTGAITAIPIAPDATSFDITADGTTAVITHNRSTQLISVIDLGSASVQSTHPTGTALASRGVSVSDDGAHAAFVTPDGLRVIDLTSGSVGPLIPRQFWVSGVMTTRDGNHALSLGTSNAALIEYESGAEVSAVDTSVTTYFGVVSPTDDRVALCSVIHNDDLVVVDTRPASPATERVQLSAPRPESDRCAVSAVAPVSGLVLALSTVSDSLEILEPETGQVVRRVVVGDSPVSVAVTPDGARAVVANRASTHASIVDLQTGSVTDVPVPALGFRALVSLDGVYAYIAHFGSDGGISRIHLGTNTPDGAHIRVDGTGFVGYSNLQVSGVAMSPDGAMIAITSPLTDSVTLIDTSSWAILETVPVSGFPSWLAFSRDSNSLYIAQRDLDSVAMIDTASPTPAVTRTLSVGDQPWHLIDDGDGNLLVNDWEDQTIRRVRISDGSTTAFLALPDYCTGLVYSPATDRIYAASGTSTNSISSTNFFLYPELDGHVSVINPGSLSLIGTVELGVAPSSLTVDPTGSVLTAPAPYADSIAIIPLDAGCNAADLAEPYFSLDFDDVLAFLSAFGMQTPAADIAVPLGVFDFADVLAYLGAFGAGCP